MLQLGPPLKPERFSCRIYGVLRRQRQILLTRSRFLAREFVNFPGGGVEIGEPPIGALRREYEEETGIAIEPVRVLYASEGAHVSSQNPIQIVGVYWLVEETGGALREPDGREVVRLFWADIDRIPTEEMFSADHEFAQRLPKLL